MVEQELVDRLVEVLRSARDRPAMYFGTVAVEPAVCWLHGFATAVKILLGDDFEARRQVLSERGWTWSARHPSVQMIERGLSTSDVVDELMVIELEVVLHALSR